MNENLFTTLLYQSEGTDLDFKRQQYKFAHATDEEKSNLLKDVLTFANSWRQNDAHIVIGVDAKPDGTCEQCGVSPQDHIDDAALQQFINSKTNRPVNFNYEPFSYKGKSFGIITIPKQNRPFYSKKDFGLVRKGEIYFRRGSSCAIATPEEIHLMGQDDTVKNESDPIIKLELADLEQHKIFGTSIQLISVRHDLHDSEKIPLAKRSDDPLVTFSSMLMVNKEYWRELANYVWMHRATKHIALAVTNTGSILADNVNVAIEFPKNCWPIVIEESDMPDYPKYEYEFSFVQSKIVRASDFLHRENTPIVKDHRDRWTLSIDYGAVQPKATAWTNAPLYLAPKESGTYTLEALIYADNIRQPQETKIDLDFRVEHHPALTIEELREIHKWPSKKIKPSING